MALTIADFDNYGLGVEDVIEGLYWYCSDFHRGQNSLEYVALSRLSDVFHPGLLAHGPEPFSGGAIVYNLLFGDDLQSLAVLDLADAALVRIGVFSNA